MQRPDRTLGAVDGLAQLSFVVQGMLERQAAVHDLSMVQVRLVGILRDRVPTMGELAGLLGLDKSSVSGLVDRAERRGLVTRTSSPSDRRAVRVQLTDGAREIAAAVEAGFSAEVTALLAHLPAARRGSLSTLVTRMLVAHAAERGVDLYDTVAPVGAARLD
jgi:MarR family transcriptional regulator, lower aerobic nicotinate degradation pathway regulator